MKFAVKLCTKNTVIFTFMIHYRFGWIFIYLYWHGHWIPLLCCKQWSKWVKTCE